MKLEHYPAGKLKKIIKDPLFWSSLVLIVVIGVLFSNFEFNFGAIKAQVSQVMGQGTPRFVAKWVGVGAPIGTIAVNATLDGSPWTGNVDYSISGPSPVSAGTYSLPQTYTDRNTGSYTLAYNSGGPAGSVLSSITSSATQNLSAGGTITFTLNFTSGGPTLSVILTANPNTGNAPLNPTITATVGGTAIGAINYTFYCDRNDDGTNITAPWNAKFDNISETTKTITCSYSSAGTYYPKVIIVRGALAATDKKTATVQAPVNNLPTALLLPPQVSGTGNSLSNDCKINDAMIFSWNYSDPDGDLQTAFQFQVSLTNNFVSPVYDSSKQNGSANSLTVNTLPANTYYWRLKVWDARGADSGWISGSQFTVSSQKAVDFSWVPKIVFVYQQVTFIPTSTIPISSITSYHWNFTGGLPPDSSASFNPLPVIFTSVGPKDIRLDISTNTGQSCSVPKTLVVSGGGEI